LSQGQVGEKIRSSEFTSGCRKGSQSNPSHLALRGGRYGQGSGARLFCCK